MIQSRRRPSFTPKSLKRLRVLRQLIRKKFQRHVATELHVFSLVNHTHAAATQPAKNPVMGECLAFGLGRSSHWRGCLGEAGGGSTAMRSGTEVSEEIAADCWN